MLHFARPMNRVRDLLFTCVVLLVCLASAAAQETPNFILIMTDDQGYGDLGSYGSPHIRTPRIEVIISPAIDAVIGKSSITTIRLRRPKVLRINFTTSSTIPSNRKTWPRNKWQVTAKPACASPNGERTRFGIKQFRGYFW